MRARPRRAARPGRPDSSPAPKRPARRHEKRATTAPSPEEGAQCGRRRGGGVYWGRRRFESRWSGGTPSGRPRWPPLARSCTESARPRRFSRSRGGPSHSRRGSDGTRGAARIGGRGGRPRKRPSKRAWPSWKSGGGPSYSPPPPRPSPPSPPTRPCSRPSTTGCCARPARRRRPGRRGGPRRARQGRTRQAGSSAPRFGGPARTTEEAEEEERPRSPRWDSGRRYARTGKPWTKRCVRRARL
mmetsp:Transcript_33466/g.75661  ORF Transcript_33466/g.75661 Transcript_33466/m.75661 type:complete len:243 (-) Transcript_33466:598-1326(-)